LLSTTATTHLLAPPLLVQWWTREQDCAGRDLLVFPKIYPEHGGGQAGGLAVAMSCGMRSG
jgi:hypothetical protein